MSAVSPDIERSAGLLRFAGRAMASPLRLTLAGDVTADLAELVWAEVQAEFVESEQAMSRFRDDSGLTALNRAAMDRRAIAVEPRLRRAVVAADRARRVTAGAFDPRVLHDLDRLGYRGARLPSRTRDAPQPDGRPTLDERPSERVAAFAPDRTLLVGAPVDLGGIGKGLALRWAAARIRRVLPPGAGALVEAGGDVVTFGCGPDAGSWPIGIEDPSGGEDLAVVSLRVGALATSSIRINRWVGDDGTVTHHLLDPRTGEPGGEGLLAVTVAESDPAWAEVRTKELFLAGARAIGSLARCKGLAAWWVDADGTLEMTPAARVVTLWVASEERAP